MSSTQLSTRDRILTETIRLMEQHRGQGVRIEDVAQAAGVSRQAVYMHFGSRSELLIASARYLDEILRLQERLQEVCSARSALQMLDAYVDFWAGYIPDIYGLAKALLAVRETDEGAAAAWNDRMQAAREGCLSIVRCLERDGVLAPEWTVDEATDFFWAMSSIATWENLTIDCHWSQEQYITRMKQVLKSTLMHTT